MDEEKIKRKLREFAKERDWEQFHTLKNLAISINLESSELLEIFQWEKDDSTFSNNEMAKERIKEEVADILLYLIRFADLSKIDLEKVCLEKIKLNKKKYPVNLSKGKSTKYSRLKKGKIVNNRDKIKFKKLSDALRKNLKKRKEIKNGDNA